MIAFLRYVYCEELQIDEGFAVDLYRLSDKWLVKGLNIDCCEFLKQNITLENFGRIAQLASDVGEEELFEVAASYGLKKCGKLEEEYLKDVRGSVLRKMICKCQRVEFRKKKDKKE